TGIVRREGTPLVLTSADGKTTYKEGIDFEPVPNDRKLKSIVLKPDADIAEGDTLILNCYRTPFIRHAWGRQISVCMSNPGLYTYWEKQAKAIHDKLKVKRVLLSMDEIRNGGGCKTCLDRKISMAEILGDCVNKQYKMFKDIDPEIEVLIWSDMFDPNHNARGDYYGVVGDFTDAHKYLPEGIILACWYHKMRDKTLPFFSGLGFRTFGAAYYDKDDLTNPREWLTSLRATPKAMGIMYTTWQRKYELMDDFGDLVNGKD
ncbi:hypothetical protein ACFL4W_05340, partial [Planctomycetota bacterium]